MSDEALADKVAYFKEQGLLDISDDEHDFPDEGYLNIERALADTKAMPPPLVREKSSFLGLTPRERQAEFETYASMQRASARNHEAGMERPITAPEADGSQRVPSTKQYKQSSTPGKHSRRTKSLPEMGQKAGVQDKTPFYQRIGVIPRELKGGLKGGKPVKPDYRIKLEPDHKQLLRAKIIYFYPNNDISGARRQRIHKIIQLGAAWVTSWRDDITHIMVDDGPITYSQVLKHLNRAELPRKVILVKFDPYVPQCIQFNTLLEPTAGRFQVKGAPRPDPAATALEPSSSLPSSQVSLKIKPTRKQLAIQNSQRTDSTSTGESVEEQVGAQEAPSNSFEDIVKDSFIIPSSYPGSPAKDEEETARSLNTYNDALSEAIQQTKAVAHLPLEEEEDEDSSSSRPTTANGQQSDSGTDEEPPEPIPKRHKRFKASTTGTKVRGVKGINALTFQCMDPRGTNATASLNPNARTIQVLEDMSKYYDLMQDQWRTLAYRRGITTLRKQTTKISTKEQAHDLPFIGSRLAEKIEEIVLTDRLRRLDSTREDPTDKVLRLFLGIYGAGLSQANKWIQAGHRTLDDLINKARLTDSQKVGIEHYDDFAQRIPRAEVEAHGTYIRNALRRIDPGFQVHIMGSYRRGAKDSGDIDCIITKAGASLSSMRAVVFSTLVPRLFSASFLKVSLATSRRAEDGTKWHGASCLPGSRTWRRLDLLLVPEAEMGAALIYFTGNDIFNRSMRLLASKKGMRLNQRGLYKDVIRGKNRERLNEGTLIEGRDERRIFEILGVPWRGPEERIC